MREERLAAIPLPDVKIFDPLFLISAYRKLVNRHRGVVDMEVNILERIGKVTQKTIRLPELEIVRARKSTARVPRASQSGRTRETCFDSSFHAHADIEPAG